MARKGKNKMKTMTGWLIAIFVILILGFGAITNWYGLGAGEGLVIGGSGSTTGAVDFSGCPDDGDTSFKLDIFNSANTTGAEGVDATVYLFDSDNVLVATITDTTGPDATTLDCGDTYTAKMISTSGASGDPSVFDSVTGGATISDGNLVFTTDDSSINLRAQIEQHATLGCRAYNNQARGYMYDSADGDTTGYETDGVTFTSITDNATATDETLGFDMSLECKAVQSDTDYNDRGILVLLEMPTTIWDEPVVYANGNRLTEVTLEGSEKDAYVDYEYAFLIPDNIVIKDGSEGIDVRVVNQLKSGISAVTADPQVDLAVRGAHLATDSQSVISNTAVTDASTPAQIHVLFDTTWDMT